MTRHSGTRYLSKTHDLFRTNAELKAKRIDEIHELVNDAGLDALYHRIEDFGIGTDIFLHADELKHILQIPEHPAEPRTIEIAEKSAAQLSHPDIQEADGSPIRYMAAAPFESWESTISNLPAVTFVPKSKQGLQNLVKWASDQDLRIRAAGYRHTSSDAYSQDGGILVAMVDPYTATHLPAQHPPMNPDNDLQGIELTGNPYECDGMQKIQCKIGASTCLYHFLDWVHDVKRGNYQWAIPFNVIMNEISFGGSNAMICHGAGIHNKTVSDLVKSIEFVNVKGELQTVSSDEWLKAASGCFGLLGPVTSLTLQLDRMTYANMSTAEKRLLAISIPPPAGYKLPAHLKHHLNKDNLALLDDEKACDAAFEYFVDCCEKNYYAEWFWYPMQDKCWINCWQNNGDKDKSRNYPSAFSDDVQRIMSYIAYLGTTVLGDNTPPVVKKIQTKLLGHLSMLVMPDREEIICPMEDAIHFRRGIQNYKARMTEIEIPVPDHSVTGQTDWSVCQKAWWDVLDVFYQEKHQKNFPMRTTLEMRIMDGTDHVLMAPQYGNKRTCSIEILTPVSVKQEVWDRFLQDVLDKWAELKDDQGRYLNIRPHWAKRFDHLVIHRSANWMKEWSDEQHAALLPVTTIKDGIVSVPMRDYLKHIAFKDQIAAFVKTLDTICQAGGYQLKDIQKRFSNPFFDDMVFGCTSSPTLPEKDQPATPGCLPKFLSLFGCHSKNQRSSHHDAETETLKNRM